MGVLYRVFERNSRLIFVYLVGLGPFSLTSLAQQSAPRITTEIDSSERAVLQGSRSTLAKPENDAGRVPGETKLQGMNIVFSPTAAQEADLQSLIAAQQDPSSPLYHHWLTPEEFSARFGVSDSDIEKVTFWLQKQGLTIDGVSRSKNRITFSGTVAQVEQTFSTELHYYSIQGQKHFAPSTDLTIPAALSPLVAAVTNLSTFRPHPRVKLLPPQYAPNPNFTSSVSGNHFLTPKDVAKIYDIKTSYSSGYTGTGQAIAVVGQSAIALTDIEHFQTAAGFAVKDAALQLVPNSGTATVVSGDEAESDLDLEYSSTIGYGATIYFVYTGNGQNYNVWDSIQYAIDNKIAPIVSTSYGTCEPTLNSSDYSFLESLLAQAATQGQTVLGPSGDNGSTDCYDQNGSTALAVDYPASSAYVTGIGGTEFPSADVAASNTTYWQSASGSDVIGSALSYIPEQVWNDDSSSGLSAGGGGVSTLTSRPSWQTGVTGIPSGNYRLVPDISLDASPNNAGYLFCSSDTSAWSQGQQGSCTSGFRDSSTNDLTFAGGTSFGPPIFAGMLAILNQKLNSSGQGLINPTLYSLAANSSTYGSAFHDVTSGTNACPSGAIYCSSAGASEYPAGTGYDEATGLGSVDFYNLLTAWPGSSTAKNFSLSATKLTVSAGGTVSSTVTITPNNGYTGTITFTVTSSPSLTNGCFSLSNATVSGSSAVTATLTIHTSASACASGSMTGPVGGGSRFLHRNLPTSRSWHQAQRLNTMAVAQLSVSLAMLFFVAFISLRSISRSLLVSSGFSLFLLAAICLSASGCGSSGSPNSNNSPKGTYTVTIVGTDTSSSSITASTTMTLTVD